MLKEIHEQADAVAETVADRLAGDTVELGEIGDLRRRAARARPDHDRRLRHLVPRRPRRSLRDRAVGPRPRGDGHRLRVPLPQPGHRRAPSRDRHLAVGRDRRHARRHAPRSRGRREGPRDHERDGKPGDTGRRRRPLHARRDRDRRRRDEDLRRPGRRPVPAGAPARRASRRPPRASASRSSRPGSGTSRT